MFFYLSKKIAIPKFSHINCISWNQHGWIAIGGGNNGLLKILNIEKQSSINGSINLSSNQALEGHSGEINCIAWNPHFNKLTTSDENGLIIVWTLHKNIWYEEMINNRNKSIVKDMKWNYDGQKICIIYEDGAIIVGSVDGSRIWNKELEFQLKAIEWSPDGSNLLLVSPNNIINIYDMKGSVTASITIDHPDVQLASIICVKGSNTKRFMLYISFDNGVILLWNGSDRSYRVLLNTEKETILCSWSHQCDVVAMCSKAQANHAADTNMKEHNVIQFYNRSGILIQTVKLPGSTLSGIAWEQSGLRLAATVDSHLYFVQVRPSYNFVYFASTVVYALRRGLSDDFNVTFWNQKTNQAAVQTVPNVMFLKSMSNLELCILVYTKEGIDAPEASQDNILIDIRSSSGVTLAKRSLPFLPTMVCCSKTSLIFLANEKRILMLDVQSNDWSCDRGSGVEFCKGKERIVDVAFDIDRFGVTNNILSLNAIKCLCASEKYLAIGLSDGSLVIYNLPYMSIEQILHVDCDPSTIEFNKSSTKISVVATTGILSLFEINLDSPCIDGAADSSQRIHKLPLERKDVWNVMWAEDHDDELAMMEKAKLIIISGQQVEEVANSCGYLMSFKDLSVKILLIEDLATSASINREGCIVDIKTKLLNELETKIGNGDLEDAYNFAQSNKFHMRLWTRLAEAALVALKLSMAEKCFVHCSDYFGIQFVKQLTLMTDKMKMRAEVDVYLKKFDEAENIYRDIDRRDLAIDLRKRLGDYVRAVQLLRSGSVDNDDDVQKSLDSIGDDFSDRLMWTKASRCYAESGNTLKQLKCSVKYTKKYDDIRKLIASIPDGCKWMTEAAHMLEAAGLHKEASECFLRSGDVKASIDCHIAHNQWKEALALAEEHSFHQVEGLFTRLTTKLALDTHISKKLEAVDLFRVADRPQEAAMLIAEIAEIVAREECDPLMAKRLQVLAALEVERHRKRQHLSLHSTSDVSGMAKTTLATFDTMMMTSLDTQSSGASKRASNAFSSAWRGAAAYHYFILAQRQLTAGNFDDAMKTAIRCCEYDDILKAKDIYSILALSALKNDFYDLCSKSFIQLETLDAISEEEREGFESLAIRIFSSKSPQDPEKLESVYVQCLQSRKPFKACLITGRAILSDPCHSCTTCRHSVLQAFVTDSFFLCPLCHSHVDLKPYTKSVINQH